MKKNFLFTLMAVFLAGFGFGGISMADEPLTCNTVDGNSNTDSSNVVATIGENKCFTTFENAVSALNDNETIKMVKDYEITVDPTSGQLIIDKTATLDLNGHSLSRKTSSVKYLFQVNGVLTIIDSGKNGKLIRENGTSGIMVLGKLTLESGTIQVGNGCIDYANGCNGSTIAIKCDENGYGNKGTVIIEGGKIISDGQAIQAWGDVTIGGGEIEGDVNAWSAVSRNPGKIIITKGVIKGGVAAIQWYKNNETPTYAAEVDIQGGVIEGTIKAQYNVSTEHILVTEEDPTLSGDPKPVMRISGGTFLKDPDNAYIGEKCSIKNSEGKFVVATCPTATKTFVTNSNTEIPVVYTEESETISFSNGDIENTKALLKKLIAQIPSDTTDANLIATRMLLNSIISAESFNNLAEIKKIDTDYILFANAGTQTKGFVQKDPTLTYTPYAFKNGTEIVSDIVFDITDPVNPIWVTPSTEKVSFYNTVKKGGDVIGYTLNMNTENDGWFYAPKAFKVTFNSDGGSSVDFQIVPLTNGKATKPETDPTKEGNIFDGWFKGEETTAFNFDTVITENTELKAHWSTAYTITLNEVSNGTISSDKATAKEGDTITLTATPASNYNFSSWTVKNGDADVTVTNNQFTMPAGNVTVSATFTAKPSGGSYSGGGGSSRSSSKTTTTDDTKKVEDTSKTDETKADESKSDETKADETKTSEEAKAAADAQALKDGYSQEFIDAYNFARKNNITTKDTIREADMDAPLTRIAMAKMLSQYAINVLGKTPDTTVVVPTFPDVDAKLDADYNNGVTLAYQLGIMGIGIEKFRPFDLVTRAEFGTALSRMLFGLEDGEGNEWYSTHLAKLMEEQIITNNNPNLKELRGYVMIMLMRSAQ